MTHKDFLPFLNGVFVGIFGGLFITAIWDIPEKFPNIIPESAFAIVSLIILYYFITLYRRKDLEIIESWFLFVVLLAVALSILIVKFYFIV